MKHIKIGFQRVRLADVVNMEKLFDLENIKEIDCGHSRKTGHFDKPAILKTWMVTKKDEIVTELPAGEIILIHDCEKLKVWQQK